MIRLAWAPPATRRRRGARYGSTSVLQGYPPDLIRHVFREPQVSLGSRRDPEEPCMTRGEWVLEDGTHRCDATDRAATGIGEPDRAIGPESDPERPGSRGKGELVDRSVGGDPADAGAKRLGEPQVPVGAGGDAPRMSARRRRWEFADGPARSDAADLAGDLFGEPHPSVWAGGDARGIAGRRRHWISRHARRIGGLAHPQGGDDDGRHQEGAQTGPGQPQSSTPPRSQAPSESLAHAGYSYVFGWINREASADRGPTCGSVPPFVDGPCQVPVDA